MPISEKISPTLFASDCEPPLRVLILNHRWLVGAAIASLLSPENDFELDGLTTTSAPALPDIVDRFSVDAIVIDNLMASDDEIRSLYTVFSDHPRVRVFVIRIEANWVDLNGSERVVITQAGDLAALIRCHHTRVSGPIQSQPGLDI